MLKPWVEDYLYMANYNPIECRNATVYGDICRHVVFAFVILLGSVREGKDMCMPITKLTCTLISVSQTK